MTVSKAYSLLEAAGVLERRRGLGMVVAESHERRRPLAERLEILRPTLERAAEETAQLEIDPDVALQHFGKMLKGKG
jgi:GntR family transcriptional regulator